MVQILWKPHRYDWRDQHRIIWVSVAALDALWRRDIGFYVGQGGVGGNAFRYDRFGKWLQASKPRRRVKMPVIGFPDRCVSFEDGRHRFAWLRDHGATAVPILVFHTDADALASAAGTLERKTIINSA